MEKRVIDPERLYAFTEAKKLVPSRKGGHVCLRTLHRWRVDGLIECHFVQHRFRRSWFVRGAELLRLMEFEPAPPPPTVKPRSEYRAKRDFEMAMDDLRRFYPNLARDVETKGTQG